MRSPGINGGELRGQPANPGSHGKMAVKTECVCVCVIYPHRRRLWMQVNASVSASLATCN